MLQYICHDEEHNGLLNHICHIEYFMWDSILTHMLTPYHYANMHPLHGCAQGLIMSLEGQR